MTETMEGFKIIYVIGTGRNGSTLLDVVLGNSQKVQSTGELYNAVSVWQKNKTCSCGKEVSSCDFWSRVKKLLDGALDSLDLKNTSETLRRFERGTLSLLSMEFHRIAHSHAFEQYERFLKELYTSVFTVSAKPILVDSSKNPFRGYALLNVFKGKVYFVHLVRDGRGQMWSWMKNGLIPPFGIHIKKTNVDDGKVGNEYYWWTPWLYTVSWLAYSLLSSFVIWKAGHEKSIRIQYEDFLNDPSHHIKRISDLVDEDLSDLDQLVASKQPLKIDHLIAGNRLRMTKQLSIKLPDEEWKTRLQVRYKKVFWLIAGWLARSYGYRF